MKIPKIRKLPSGNYFCQLRIDGKSIPITERTEALCAAKAMSYKSGLTQKNAPCNLTLREAIDLYVMERKNVLSPSTIRGYRTIQRNRFQSVMGKPLDKPTNWQKVVNDEACICAPKTIYNAWGLIGSVLRANKVTVPSVTLPAPNAEEHLFLEPDQIFVFLKAAKGADGELAALLALHSLRASEILALTWDKIDYQDKLITVKGAVVPDENNKLVHKKKNKNVTSTRIVPIMIPRLLELLEQKRGDDKDKLVDVASYTMCRRIDKICRENDLPEVGTHGMRHTFASLGYHLKLSEREVCDIGGWKDTTVVHKIYTHLAKIDRLKAQNTMTRFYAELSY